LNLYWVGVRQTDIADCEHLFCGSVTVFGDGRGNNISMEQELGYRVDHNDPDTIDRITRWWIKKLTRIIENDADSRFCFYNPIYVLRYHKSAISSRIVCLNDESLLNLLDDKFRLKRHFARYGLPFKILPYKEVVGANWVVQRQYSSGGAGTYLPTSDHKLPIADDERVLITEYLPDNIPVNVHLIISDKVEILQPSIQKFRLADTFEYLGGDFAGFERLPSDVKKMCYDFASEIGQELQKMGYRGVCGLDLIVVGDQIYFMEINPRFQGSTAELNKILRAKGELTVHDRQLRAFGIDL
jgi:predicted ATP-grasp superfamily ATP-dependent carboligase